MDIFIQKIRLNKKIEELQKFPSSNVLCFPMIDNRTRKVVGVLRVSNMDAKKLFTRKDQILLNGLAHIAMTVLSNARIHASALADRVKTDSLLKLAKSLNEQEETTRKKERGRGRQKGRKKESKHLQYNKYKISSFFFSSSSIFFFFF